MAKGSNRFNNRWMNGDGLSAHSTSLIGLSWPSSRAVWPAAQSASKTACTLNLKTTHSSSKTTRLPKLQCSALLMKDTSTPSEMHNAKKLSFPKPHSTSYKQATWLKRGNNKRRDISTCSIEHSSRSKCKGLSVPLSISTNRTTLVMCSHNRRKLNLQLSLTCSLCSRSGARGS